MVTHRYTSAGLYTVQLTVVDDDGKQDTALHQITIRIRI
jgi:PKD repeat protein